MADLTDKEILNAIFSPLLPHGDIVYKEDFPEEANEVEDETDATRESKVLEVEGVKLAEMGDLEGSLKLFTQAIEKSPSKASCYNNRAQTLRLMGKIDDALNDLNTAIRLSEGKGRVAAQSYCQRGLIQLKVKGQMSDEAKADFETAAELGSNFATAQLVQMNPYAALCNKMLKQVFTKLQNGESTTDINEDAL